MKTVIELAREAGFLEHKDSFYTNHRYGDCKLELELLVELAHADEREACLDLAKDFAHNNIDLHDAIRARGNT